jgi:hypothetical protein
MNRRKQCLCVESKNPATPVLPILFGSSTTEALPDLPAYVGADTE